MWPFTRMIATRTRPKTLSASRRKRRPELECLEEKKVLSTVFGAYASGETWAYNDQAGWREINPAIPVAMKEGADGTLFASYTSGPHVGTYRYDYSTNQWTGLTSWVASVLSASTDNTMFATFSGQGTWELDASWHQLASHDATMLAAVSDNNVYAVLTGDKTGTWHAVNNGWNKLTAAIPTVMDASPDGTMYASYSDGTYQYAGYSNLFWDGWTKITSNVATQVVAIDNSGFVGSFADGTDEYYQDLGWNHIALYPDVVASHLGYSRSTSTLILSSGSDTYEGQGIESGTMVLDQIDWGNPALRFG